MILRVNLKFRSVRTKFKSRSTSLLSSLKMVSSLFPTTISR